MWVASHAAQLEAGPSAKDAFERPWGKRLSTQKSRFSTGRWTASGSIFSRNRGSLLNEGGPLKHIPEHDPLKPNEGKYTCRGPTETIICHQVSITYHTKTRESRLGSWRLHQLLPGHPLVILAAWLQRLGQSFGIARGFGVQRFVLGHWSGSGQVGPAGAETSSEVSTPP